jgi:hypothetical protein
MTRPGESASGATQAAAATAAGEGRDTQEIPRHPPDGDRAAQRAVTRVFRPRRTIPAVIVALLLAAASILAAIEVISYLIDRPAGVLPAADLARWTRETQWDDALVITLAIIACLLGLLLLLLAFWPGRARGVALATERPDVVMAMSESDLARLANRAAEAVDGVDRASTQVGRGRVAVRADSPLYEPGDLTDRLHGAVSDQLDALAPLRPKTVRVNVRHKGAS